MKPLSMPENKLTLFKNTEDMDYSLLLQIKEQSEKQGEAPFSQFDDRDMLAYFLYQQTNIDQKKNKSERTIKEYQRELTMMVEHMLRYADEMDLDIDRIIEGSLFKSLSKRHLRRYQAWVVERCPHVIEKGPYSPATVARKTVIWKSFFSFLHRSGYIKEAVHEGLLSATVRKEDRPNRDLGPNEVVQLLDYFKQENHSVIFGLMHILVATGLRNEELCKFKVSDVKYDSLFGEYYLSVWGKGNKHRSIPLKPKVVESSRRYREARLLDTHFSESDDSPLFPTSTGNAFSPSYLSQYLGKAIERTGLSFLQNRSCRITAHTFRHSFAIISRRAGADIYKLCEA
ncbi:tyrosine-type recombinase/integrase [Pseudobacillus wudalianchiensis]|uniref:tyrosine-type recombinase/integrase n=1 Tax=Pseudobacillus wudalianchiensis TaxID=1743143 RepID=UPI001FE07B2A|nr:tyrosine-type recombinase/integrase [Bacillus wudalianchiensis]